MEVQPYREKRKLIIALLPKRTHLAAPRLVIHKVSHTITVEMCNHPTREAS